MLKTIKHTNIYYIEGRKRVKKIAVLLLLVLALAGCAIFRTTDVVITNNSDHIAFMSIWNLKKDGDHKGIENIEMQPHTSTSYKLYDDGRVELNTPNRNFLKKHSNKSYEILNSPRKTVTVFNKTGEKISLMESNNLFDKVDMLPNEVRDIDVFTIDKFYPHAINEQGIVLKISIQSGLVITF